MNHISDTTICTATFNLFFSKKDDFASHDYPSTKLTMKCKKKFPETHIYMIIVLTNHVIFADM